MLSAIISAGFLALSVASLAIPIPENQVPAELESKFPNNFFQHRAPPTRGGNGNGKNVGGNSVNAPDHGKSIEGAAVNAPEEAKLRGFNVKVDNNKRSVDNLNGLTFGSHNEKRSDEQLGTHGADLILWGKPPVRGRPGALISSATEKRSNDYFEGVTFGSDNEKRSDSKFSKDGADLSGWRKQPIVGFRGRGGTTHS